MLMGRGDQPGARWSLTHVRTSGRGARNERGARTRALMYIRTYECKAYIRTYVRTFCFAYVRTHVMGCGADFVSLTYARVRAYVLFHLPRTYARTYVRTVSLANVRYVLFHLPRTYALTYCFICHVRTYVLFHLLRTYVLFPLPRTLAWRCQDAPTTAARAELSDALYGPALGNRRSAAAAASDQGEKAWPSWGAVSAAAGAVQANANSEGRDVHDQRQRTACWLGVAKMLFTMKC